MIGPDIAAPGPRPATLPIAGRTAAQKSTSDPAQKPIAETDPHDRKVEDRDDFGMVLKQGDRAADPARSDREATEPAKPDSAKSDSAKSDRDQPDPDALTAQAAPPVPPADPALLLAAVPQPPVPAAEAGEAGTTAAQRVLLAVATTGASGAAPLTATTTPATPSPDAVPAMPAPPGAARSATPTPRAEAPKGAADADADAAPIEPDAAAPTPPAADPPRQPAASAIPAPPMGTDARIALPDPGASGLSLTPVANADWRLSAHAAAQAFPREAATHAATSAQAVVSQISVAVGQAEDRRVEIRLDPPELGRVHIHLTPTDQGLQATVTAERPETHALLRRHADALARDLGEAGFGSVTLDFATGGRDAQAEGDRRAAASQSFAAAPTPLAPIAAAPVRRAAGDGALDIRL